jgi:hypothetical protein
MGNWWSSVLDALSGTKHRQILLLGLDAAGKTTSKDAVASIQPCQLPSDWR